MRRFLGLVLLPAGLWAYTLGDLVDASAKSDQAQIDSYRQQAAESSLSAARRAYWPTVDVGARFSEVDEVSMEPEAALSATLSWTIFDGFARENEIAARVHEARAARLERTHNRNGRALQTVRYYFNLLAAKESFLAQASKVRHLSAEYDRLKGFEQVGVASAKERAQIAAALEAARYELADLEVRLLDFRLILGDLTGLTLDGYEPVLTALIEPQTAGLALERSDLLAQREQISALSSRADALRAVYFPQITLENVLSKNSYDDEIAFDLPEDQNRFSIALSFRLLDFRRMGKEREAARLQKRAEEHRLSYAERRAQSEARLARYRLQSAQKQVASAAQALTSSELVFEQVQKKFRSRLASEIDYLDALSEKTQAHARLAAARSDYEVAKAEYYYAHGTPIEEKIP